VSEKGTEEDGKLLSEDFVMEEKFVEVNPLTKEINPALVVKEGVKTDLTRYLPDKAKGKVPDTFAEVKSNYFANKVYQPVPADGEAFHVGYEYEVSKTCPGYLKSEITLHLNVFNVDFSTYVKEFWWTFKQGASDKDLVNPVVDHVKIICEPTLCLSDDNCKKQADKTQRFVIMICYSATEPWGAKKRVEEFLLKKVDANGKFGLIDSGDITPDGAPMPGWSVPFFKNV
tara:strand:- start:156 stop:842 length:687 start_codon:yes stop_codon:yes gene_type:complete